MKNLHSGAVFYFQMPFAPYLFLKAAPPDAAAAFKAKWQGEGAKAGEASGSVAGLPGGGDVGATAAFCAGRLGAVGASEAAPLSAGADGVVRSYHHALTLTNALCMVELSFKAGYPGCKLALRCDQPAYAPLLRASIEALFKL